MAMFWYLDLLTYGRGAFLAMVLALFAALWCYRSLVEKSALVFRDQLFGFGVAVMGVVCVASTLPFSNMASRFAVDRWSIWIRTLANSLHWIDSWLNTSVFWGQGWGLFLQMLPWASWSKIRTIFMFRSCVMVGFGLCYFLLLLE